MTSSKLFIIFAEKADFIIGFVEENIIKDLQKWETQQIVGGGCLCCCRRASHLSMVEEAMLGNEMLGVFIGPSPNVMECDSRCTSHKLRYLVCTEGYIRDDRCSPLSTEQLIKKRVFDLKRYFSHPGYPPKLW